MGKIGAVNIANSSRIIHYRFQAKNGGKFYYSPHTIAGRLMILSYPGRIVCRLQALAMGDTGLAKC